MWLQKNESLSSPPSSPSLTHLKVYMESGTMVSEVDREVIHPPPCQQDLLHFQPVKGWQSVNAHHQKSEKLRLQRENLVGETPKTTRWKFTPTPHPPPPSYTRLSALKVDWLLFTSLPHVHAYTHVATNPWEEMQFYAMPRAINKYSSIYLHRICIHVCTTSISFIAEKHE